MATKRCAKCAETIQWKAQKCRHCGTDQPAPVGSEPMGTGMKLFLVIGGIVLLFFWLVLFGPRNEGAVALARCDEKISVGGENFYKLSPQERMDCRYAVIEENKAKGN